MWSTGMMNGVYYEVKHYEEGSVFGICEGKISKLFMRRDRKVLISYDRGWDVRPDPAGDPEAYAVYQALLNKYNY